MRPGTFSRRKFMSLSAAAGAAVLTGARPKPAEENGMKVILTILHTNDLHSNFVGMGPASDYTPFTLNDDSTRGGYARLAALIAARRAARESQGPVLVLDAGDFSMGTAFAAASREIGGELRLMSRMGYDATTFGNHEFDLGPDGLGQVHRRGQPRPAGSRPCSPRTPASSGDDPTLAGLQRLSEAGLIRRSTGDRTRRSSGSASLGCSARKPRSIPSGGAAEFPDPLEAAGEMVKVLRETEKVDVVIALSHGGVEKGSDGRYTVGDDVRLPKAVPGIDIVIGGHSHTDPSGSDHGRRPHAGRAGRIGRPRTWASW